MTGRPFLTTGPGVSIRLLLPFRHLLQVWGCPAPAHNVDMSRWEPMQQVAQRGVAWAGERRSRALAAAAVVLFLVAGIMALFASIALNMLAWLIALLGAASALVALLTWLAEHQGTTDDHDLWDHESTESRPDEVFRGFSGFTKDQ